MSYLAPFPNYRCILVQIVSFWPGRRRRSSATAEIACCITRPHKPYLAKTRLPGWLYLASVNLMRVCFVWNDMWLWPSCRARSLQGHRFWYWSTAYV